jgi:hypothetical protein
MASTFSKRLAKLEEQLAAKINAPIAWLWLNADETEEQACAKAGLTHPKFTGFGSFAGRQLTR